MIVGVGRVYREVERFGLKAEQDFGAGAGLVQGGFDAGIEGLALVFNLLEECQ
jgi:hypothetical protein